EQAEVGRVAVTHAVTAGRAVLGDLEPEPVPAGQRGRDRPRGARAGMPGEFGPQRARGGRLTGPRQANGRPHDSGYGPLDVRAQRRGRRMNVQNTMRRHRASLQTRFAFPSGPRYCGTDCPATYCASCPPLAPALRPGKPREFANMTSA